MIILNFSLQKVWVDYVKIYKKERNNVEDD